MNINSQLKLIKPLKSPFNLIRIGRNKDGSYLIPDDLKGIKACFSPGVCNTKDFEDILAKRYKIKSYMCDFSSDIFKFKTPLIQNMQFFEKKWLDINEREDSISLENWVNKYISDSSLDLILQMDIEGAEYRNLLSTSKSILNRFRILVIEFHDFSELLINKTNNKVKLLINKLNETHICVHAHPNNCCGEIIDKYSGINIPNVIELSFLRKDRFLNQKIKINNQIPNQKDVTANSRFKRPLHLNKYWFAPKKRNFKSKLKIMKDYFYWILYGPIYGIYGMLPSKLKNRIRPFLKKLITF